MRSDHGCHAPGFILSLTGVALLDLVDIYDSNVGAVSHLMTSRCIGSLVGCLVGGRLFDRYNLQLLLILTVAMMSGTFVFLPLCGNLPLAHCASFINGMGVGAFDTGSQVRLVNIWPVNNGPVLQVFHFSFGVGSLLAPLLAQPFLSGLPRDHLAGNLSDSNTSLPESTSFLNSTVTNYYEESKIQYAFLIVSIYIAVIAVCMTLLYIVDNKETSERQASTQKVHNDVAPSNRDIRFTRTFLALTGIYVFVYVAMECSYGQMLTTFGVKSDLRMTVSSAAYLTQVFFVTFTLARVLAAVMALKVTPFGMLLASNLLLVGTYAILMPWGASSSLLLWVGTAVSGIGQASIYGAAVSFCVEYVVLTNANMSLIIVMSGVGAMLSPVLVGQFIDDFPMVLMYTCFVASLVMALVLILLHLLTRNCEKLCDADKNATRVEEQGSMLTYSKE
ncbi:sodium-dependent glucose transporter 1B-like isoform X2 [Ornithodoros turicata]|uniref:sodium-dependent glucose transporter 1B-like isoform X2 n=1 Tax=Ornithodoros turicata TaxID=34597 RepID=UPI0031388D09